jgi:hypothetical protein
MGVGLKFSDQHGEHNLEKLQRTRVAFDRYAPIAISVRKADLGVHKDAQQGYLTSDPYPAIGSAVTVDTRSPVHRMNSHGGSPLWASNRASTRASSERSLKAAREAADMLLRPDVGSDPEAR